MAKGSMPKKPVTKPAPSKGAKVSPFGKNGTKGAPIGGGKSKAPKSSGKGGKY